MMLVPTQERPPCPLFQAHCPDRAGGQAHVMGEQADKPDAHISQQRMTFAQAMAASLASIDGNAAALGQLMAMLDTFKPLFEIVTPLGSEAPGAQ